MKTTLKSKMIFWIWGISILLFSVVIYINLNYTKNLVKAKLEENAKDRARYYGKKVDEQFSKASVIPVMNAIALGKFYDGKNGKILEEYLGEILKANPYIFGSCIAYEPNTFDKNMKYYAPYYHFSDAKGGKQVFENLGDIAGYDYFNQPWYYIPAGKEIFIPEECLEKVVSVIPGKEIKDLANKSLTEELLRNELIKRKFTEDEIKIILSYVIKGNPAQVWIEPYLDTGVNIFMVTYAAPFMVNGMVRGVTTADISLLKLTEEINDIKVLNSGYAFIISNNGVLIAYPDEKVVKGLGKLETFNKELFDKMTEQMKLAKNGRPEGELGSLFITSDPHRKEDSWIYIYPIREGHFCIGFVYPEDEVLREVKELEKHNIFACLAGLALLLVVIIILANSITNPLTKLVEGVKRVAQGDLDHKIDVKASTYEVNTLKESFNTMMDDLKKYIEENQRITLEKQRIANELDVARKIQMSVIPQKFPAFPERKDIDIYGKIIPAYEVGGDFYDFAFIDEERLGFVIGDAAGKGVPGAMFMAVSRAFLKANALKGYEPGDCFRYVNELLCSEDYMNMFITMFYGTLNTKTGELHYCNAGHNPPYLMKKDGSILCLKTVNGPALGVFGEADYSTVNMEMGDGIFLYTDGITEAFNNDNELFSDERLQETLETMKEFIPEKTINTVIEAVVKFANGAPQSDDMTVMAVKYIGKNE